MAQPVYAQASFWVAAVLAALGTAAALLALTGPPAARQLVASVSRQASVAAVAPPRPAVGWLVPAARPRSAAATRLAAAGDAVGASPLVYMDAKDFASIVAGPTPVLIDFAATWCGPCKLMEPKVVEVAQKYGGRLKVYKMDCEEFGDKCVELGIQALPTLQVWRNGELLDQMAGTSMARFDQLVQAAFR